MANALERRVRVETSQSAIYPNLYVLLVAPPGVGKSQAIFPARRLVEGTKKLKLAPDDVSKASLIDALAAAQTNKIFPPSPAQPHGELMEYSSLNIFADEFGVLCPAHDSGFLSAMNALYDGRDVYRESKRSQENKLNIINPQLNMLAGTQPDFLASFLPPEAWGMGFMSRILMIYQGKAVKVPLFGKKKMIDFSLLKEDISSICELHGEFEFTQEAADLISDWHSRGMPPEPQHTKLKHYLPRRIMTTIKLCMVSSASRSDSLSIELEDVIRAQDWLIEIEGHMPDIFKDMSGPGDLEIIKELHQWLMTQCRDKDTGKSKPIHRSRVEIFLSQRTPGYNQENIYKLCVRAKIILEQPGDFVLPGNTNSLRSEEP